MRSGRSRSILTDRRSLARVRGPPYTLSSPVRMYVCMQVSRPASYAFIAWQAMVTWGPRLVGTRVARGPRLVGTRDTWGSGLVGSLNGWDLFILAVQDESGTLPTVALRTAGCEPKTRERRVQGTGCREAYGRGGAGLGPWAGPKSGHLYPVGCMRICMQVEGCMCMCMHRPPSPSWVQA